MIPLAAAQINAGGRDDANASSMPESMFKAYKNSSENGLIWRGD
jgi:hypothetical protein